LAIRVLVSIKFSQLGQSVWKANIWQSDNPSREPTTGIDINSVVVIKSGWDRTEVVKRSRKPKKTGVSVILPPLPSTEKARDIAVVWRGWSLL